MLDPKRLPLLLARVELCLNAWSSLRRANGEELKPEEELAVAEQAVKLAADPVTKAIAEADLGLLHLKYVEKKYNLPNPLPNAEILRRLRKALDLAPHHPLVWVWQLNLGSHLRAQARETNRSGAERRKLAEEALALFRAAASNTGLEAPDEDDRQVLTEFIKGASKGLESLTTS